jgi:hypothetical protein
MLGVKRSTQVSLVLMGAVGVGGASYAMGDYCQRLRDTAVANGQQEPTCRSSVWHYGHGWSLGHGWRSGPGAANFFSGSGFGSSGSTAASGSTSVAFVARGGFGSIGASLGGARA